MNKSLIIGVIGQYKCDSKLYKRAEGVGKEIARRGHTLVCGGMGGVMEAACKGAKSVGGLTVGILPGKDKSEGNKFVDVPIVTAMSHARNAIIVRTADAVIAVGGKYGTLSEIGLALSISKKVYGLGTWKIPGVIPVASPQQALDKIEEEFSK